MLDGKNLREGLDLLTAALGRNLPDSTKKRHLAKVEREYNAGVDQVLFRHLDVIATCLCMRSNSSKTLCRTQAMVVEAKTLLSASAPSPGRFRSCCDELAARMPNERDALLVLLWKLKENTNVMGPSSPGKTENVPSSANMSRPANPRPLQTGVLRLPGLFKLHAIVRLYI